MTVAETASSVDLTQLLSELGFVFFFFTREEFVTFCLICSSSDLASVSRTLFFFFFQTMCHIHQNYWNCVYFCTSARLIVFLIITSFCSGGQTCVGTGTQSQP